MGVGNVAAWLRWLGPVLCTLLLLASVAGSSISEALAQASAQTAGPQSDVASYDIQVSLDADGKRLHGSERITYRNPSADTLQEVWLRLYLNAFRSTNTQWMLEAGGSHRGFRPSAPGWIRLEQLSLAGDGGQLPLPGNNGDTEETVVRVPLPTPVFPGQTITLDVRWTAQLPQVFARTGFSEDFFMVGQWYPKLAVYDRGRWDSEPWHANAEFFADFGNYDLAFSVPERFLTGASGVRQGETTEGNGRKTVRYRAERVTDVAWTAWPGFAVVERVLAAAGASTQVELLFPPEEQPNVERHLAAVREALDAYGSWYGPYPWPKLTVVVPPAGAGGAGGMEYPTLVTTGTNGIAPGDLPPLDQGLRNLEVVTVHEIAHQWFPMQVQSNEAAEAWLDEGFADYLTTRALARRYGDDRSMLDLGPIRVGYAAQQRAVVGAMNAEREPLATPAWQFPDQMAYGATVYAKGSLALLSLERLLGEERFTRALRDYADRWRWRHPTSADLQLSLEQSTGEDLDWFFDAFVFGDDVVDYRVASLEAGQAVLERDGEVAYPVDIRLGFVDGTSRREHWSGRESRLVLSGAGREIASVSVDPDRQIALELDRLDNARVRGPDPGPSLTVASRWLALVQQLLQILGQVG